jgi:hypothetical protein
MCYERHWMANAKVRVIHVFVIIRGGVDIRRYCSWGVICKHPWTATASKTNEQQHLHNVIPGHLATSIPKRVREDTVAPLSQLHCNNHCARLYSRHQL